jgi:hypothetical protein
MEFRPYQSNVPDMADEIGGRIEYARGPEPASVLALCRPCGARVPALGQLPFTVIKGV